MTQTYSSHRRMDPWYHYVALGLLVLCIFAAFRHVRQTPLHTLHQLTLLALLTIVTLKVRTYALRVQDRVIRLEETLRMQALLPADLAAQIGKLRPAQFVALRFASDGELAVRVEEALRENLGGEELKKRIQVWRPDEFRV